MKSGGQDVERDGRRAVWLTLAGMSRVPNPEIEEILRRLSALAPSERLQIVSRLSASLAEESSANEHPDVGGEASPVGAADAITVGDPPAPPQDEKWTPQPQEPGQWGYRDRSRLMGAWTHGGTEDELVESIRAGRMPNREVGDWTT